MRSSGNWQVLARRLPLLSLINQSTRHSFPPSSLSIFCVACYVLRPATCPLCSLMRACWQSIMDAQRSGLCNNK